MDSSGKPRKPAPRTYTVRCLGPCLPEHYFQSRDPVCERVCKKCRERQEHMRLTVRHTEIPVPHPDG